MPVVDDKTPENAALMRNFCSLGLNCEFGEAQRRYGFESLDLLRWASTPPDILLRLLRAGLTNIEDGLEALDQEGREYMVRSKRYGFIWHVFAPEMSPEQILQRERARLPRMAEMLLDHIWEGERIFVRHNTVEDEDPREIAGALRAVGPNAVLLHVRPATPLHPNGSVVYQGDGLLTGFIYQFADGANVPGTTRAVSWLELCINALQVRNRWLPWREPAGPRPDFNPGPKLAAPANDAKINANGFSTLTDWAALDASLPGYPAPLLVSIQSLLAVGRCAEAGVLLDAAQFRYPYYTPFAIAAAGTAQRQGADREARRRWQAVRDRFPVAAIGIVGAAVMLRDAGRADEAETLLADVIPHLPDDLPLAIEYAWFAHARRDWSEAVLRWETVRGSAPQLIVAYTASAVALRELGRMEEAKVLLDEAAERFHDDLHVVIEQAWLAQAKLDWQEAARCWDTVRARHPDREIPYTAGARAMRELGRTDDADRLLREAIGRFPDSKSPLTEHAWLAQIQRNWPAAVVRWAAVRARYEDHAEAYVQAAQALKLMGQDDEAEHLLAQVPTMLRNAD